MSARRRRAARVRPRQTSVCCHAATPSPPASATSPSHPGERGSVTGRLTDLQRGWWLIGLAGTFVATLGFQALPPARRLDAIEAVNARQDSAFASQAAAQRVALDTIRRQLGQLLAGQCAKERDGMARVLYGCGGR